MSVNLPTYEYFYNIRNLLVIELYITVKIFHYRNKQLALKLKLNSLFVVPIMEKLVLSLTHVYVFYASANLGPNAVLIKLLLYKHIYTNKRILLFNLISVTHNNYNIHLFFYVT